MRALLLLPATLLLAACGECEDCKKDAPAAPTTAQTKAAPAADPAAEWFQAQEKDGAAAPAAERKPPVVKVAWRGSGDTIELSVWEMHCGGCALLVEEGFAAVAGVKSVTADHETSVVKVTLTDAAQRDAVIAKLPGVLEAVNEKEQKEFRVLGE